MDPISITIQLVSGVVFGNLLSGVMKQSGISIALRTILGAVGGVSGGLIYSSLGGPAALTGPLVDIYTGGFGGALLTTIIGAALTISKDMKRRG